MATLKRPGVYVTERLLPAQIAAAGTAQAAGAVAAPFASGPTTAKMVSSWYEFTKIYGGYNSLYPATFEVAAFFKNGGRDLYVQRILAADAAAASVIVGRASGAGAVATVTAKNKGADGNSLRVQFTPGSFGAGYYNLSVYTEGVTGTASDVTNDVLLEVYENVITTSTTSSDYVVSVVNQQSAYITIAVSDNVNLPAVSVYPLIAGVNGAAVGIADYNNAVSGVTGAFDNIDRPLVVFLGGIYDTLTESDANNVLGLVVQWAGTNGKHFVVLGTKSGKSATQALTNAAALAGSSYSAMYYPNYYTPDPVARSNSALRLVSPAGAVAGIFMNTDAVTGPFKAPAGIGTTVQGAVALEKVLNATELDSLNYSSAPVNAIRQLPGAGISVMGARTLKNDGTANKYVNMRRSLIYLNKALNDASQFALFENNSEKLWARINTAFTVILNDYRNAGGLRGNTPAESFYVKCDAENNTDTTIALGQVNIEVGVALEYPAEFIVITLSQKTNN